LSKRRRAVDRLRLGFGGDGACRRLSRDDDDDDNDEVVNRATTTTRD
jgi:hypothetical protein